ncbi:MAG: response regulator transcription factor [Candidatus Tectomicrobia bacterium]|uniref:Response regulator transcription factor n=1 Tax=Tectimicrobiota bacterium TaxID=2528274 RepID=A0A932GSS9_UNCTE|nr:response regulator transcription factor [Candidatus Tectomicrobia bacterium]
MSHAALGPVLIVEDDRKTSTLVALYLERDGFQTIAAYDGQQALDLAHQHHPIFVVLDLMIPTVDGWEVCRELRRSSDVPILILTAREEEMERVLGLSLGADDYVVKPFSPRELVARVKAILRRARPEEGKPQGPMSRAGLVFDLDKRRVTLNGRPISLTVFEFKLLHSLMASPGRVFSRQELLERLYPHGEAVVDRVIDVHIGKLRQKIEKNPARPRYVLTVRGLGYRFAEDEDRM